MRLQLTVGRELYQIELEPAGDAYRVTVNGKPFVVKATPAGFAVGGTVHQVKVGSRQGESVRAEVDGRPLEALILDVAKAAPRGVEAAPASTAAKTGLGGGKTEVVAPMPGKIVRVLAAVGQAVKVGQPLLVLEAMKMQNEIPSPIAGAVHEIRAKEGQSVLAADVLAVIGPA